MTFGAEDYGALKDVVAGAGSLMAAAGAIGLAWRHRANWEPSEEDIPRGGQRVAGLLAALAIALVWAKWHARTTDLASLDHLIIGLGIATLACLLAYSYLVGTQTYRAVDAGGHDTRIIGGFWLLESAKRARKKNDVTTQQLFEGAQYDVDRLWSRPSRQLAKLAFLVGYMGLVGCGTVALACGSIRVALAVG